MLRPYKAFLVSGGSWQGERLSALSWGGVAVRGILCGEVMRAVDLSVGIGALRLRNPILAASGTFGYGLEFAHLVNLEKLGGFLTKGLSREPTEGAPAPRLSVTASGMLNAVGLQNVGVRAFVRDKLPLLRDCGTAVIANVFGYTIEDYVEVLRVLEDAEGLADPEVRLSLTGRSGPLVVEIEYRVAQDNARAFHGVMQEVQLSRQRNGAYGWSIARDIADPELWTERYHCPTWLDFLRQRNRATLSERALHQRAIDFHIGPDPVRVRRMLERPFGSVRWKEDSPDRAANEVLPVTTAAGSST